MTKRAFQTIQDQETQKGFTLIEIMVVIVIIGVLVVQCHEFIIYKRNSLSIVLVPSLAVKIINTIIYFVAVVIAIKLVFHQSLGAILAASGVLGLVLGFALRGLVSDLFSGIAMSLDGNIRANDWLFFNLKGTQIKAKLVEFNWRAARFIDEDNNLILVPNSELSTFWIFLLKTILLGFFLT